MAGSYGYLDPKTAPTVHPTMMDIAWAAGIVEGEGTLYRNGRDSTFVTVCQKDRWILDNLRDRFGGSVKLWERKEGKSYKAGLYWHWSISGSRARGLIMTIYTFLSPRRKEQAKFALGRRGNPNRIKD
jgi:hypothetical protein